MMELLWLLLPVAAASGWWVARREYVYKRNGAITRNTEYFKGLNYLIDDKPDQAIAVFTRMADVDRETAETHLTLGNLFRRRGEVDRAIHIHSSLIARSNLTTDQRCQALFELGEDYLRAGLFDRAEELFRELLNQSDYTEVALSRLVHIFQQEKDWRQAMAHSDRLERISGESKRRQTAHFCCELAEEANARRLWQALPGGKLMLARDPIFVVPQPVQRCRLIQFRRPEDAFASVKAHRGTFVWLNARVARRHRQRKCSNSRRRR